jgi:small subunit ribosomal protein S30
MWKIILKSPRNQLCRSFSTALQSTEATSDTAQYPPIVKLDKISRYAMKKQEWVEKIRKIPTIEEKLLELNMPRYYGYRCLMLDDKKLPYNALPYIQYITNTELDELKARDPAESKQVDEFYNLIKSDLVDALEFECSGYNRGYQSRRETLSQDTLKRIQGSAIVKHLNRVLTRNLGSDFSHLHEADIDIDPRIEAFWFVGGEFKLFCGNNMNYKMSF